MVLCPCSLTLPACLLALCVQVSYGMTECCGKISMSIQPYDWPDQLQQHLQQAPGAGGVEDAVASATVAEAAFYDQLLERVCTSGRPFLLMEVSWLQDCACNACNG